MNDEQINHLILGIKAAVTDYDAREGNREQQRHGDTVLKDLSQRTTRCDGSDQASVRQWFKEIELVEKEHGNPGMITLAGMTCAGSLRQEFERHVGGKVTDTLPRVNVLWADVRKYLSDTFLTTDEKATARLEMSRVKQRKLEKEAAYHRRFRDLAEVAYPVDQRNPDQHEALIAAYGRGLQEDHIARHMVKERPATIDAAMKNTLDFVTRNESYDRLGRRVVPMDVDAVGTGAGARPKQKPEGTDYAESIRQLTKKVEQLANRLPPPQGSFRNQRQGAEGRPPAWNDRGQPRCFNCNLFGHLANDCQKPRRSGNGRAGANRS